MKTRKFKVGDVVHIKKGLKTNYYISLTFNKDMEEMSKIGMEVVITDIERSDGDFLCGVRARNASEKEKLACLSKFIETDCWLWRIEWFEESNNPLREGDIVFAANNKNKVVSIKNGFIGKVKELIGVDKVKVETIRCFDGEKRCYVVKTENLRVSKVKEETIMELKEKEKFVCGCCGEEIDIEDVAGKDEEGNFICEDCRDSYYFECDCCGCLARDEDSYRTVDCETICESCKEEYYIECEDCGELVNKDNAIEVTNPYGENYFICEDCRDNGNYYYCYECDNLFHKSDMTYNEQNDEWYCNEHYHEDMILGYHDFNDWEEHYVDNKNESTLKGFELEVENSKQTIENDEMAKKVQSIMDDFIVFERDGSLDSGFENISNPFTMPWLYKNEGKIKEMLKTFIDNGFTSYNKGTCGLHVHVNKSQLETSDRSVDEVISNILIILETFKNELITFSRRGRDEVERWAAFYTNNEQLSYKLVNKKKDKDGGDRYHVLNLSNYKTIEFRIFRGTLKFESFMSCIELVDNIVEIAKNEVIDGLSWDDVISYAGKYVKDYSQNDRKISSDIKVNIVPDPIFPYKKGDMIRCNIYGDIYVGKIDEVNEARDTFALKDIVYSFGLENVVKGAIFRRGDIVLIPTDMSYPNSKPAQVLGFIDNLLQVRTFNVEGEEIVTVVSCDKLCSTEINCWDYQNVFYKSETTVNVTQCI